MRETEISALLRDKQNDFELAFHWTSIEALSSILENGLLSPLEATRRGIKISYTGSNEASIVCFMTTPYSAYAKKGRVGVILPFDQNEMREVGIRKYFADRSFDPSNILGILIRDDCPPNMTDSLGDYTLQADIPLNTEEDILNVRRIVSSMGISIPIFGTSGDLYS